MVSKYTSKFLFLLGALLFLGCSKDNDIVPEEATERMVLVYIAANNDLQTEALNSIRNMQAGAEGLNGVLLAFVKTNPTNSHLLRIKYSSSNAIVSDTIKTYHGENSSDHLFLRSVIADSRAAYPAKNYGLVLWSHATSWAPPSPYSWARPPSYGIMTKSFGLDNGMEMDLLDLKEALPADFEYILFDACSMASIEVIYELRDKAKYILASPAEVLSTGFPYREITPHLFGGVDGLKLVSQKFIEHYRSLPGLYASATVSLIDTRELERIAQLTNELLSAHSPKPGFNIHQLQRLYFEIGASVPAYDFISFLENNYEADTFAALQAQIEKAILFQGHTDTFFNVPISRFSGITVYLPTEISWIEDYYNTLAWSTASGWNRLFTYVEN